MAQFQTNDFFPLTPLPQNTNFITATRVVVPATVRESFLSEMNNEMTKAYGCMQSLC